MLSWVVKVVPQLPEPPPKTTEEKKEEKPAAAPPPATAPPPVAAPPPDPAPVPEKKVTFQNESKNEAPKADKPKQEVQAAEENGPAPVSQPAVLTWISSALPQPSPKLSRANSTTKEENTTPSKPEDEKGMIAWIAQGLEKVVPQPELNKKETAAAAAAEPPAEVRPTVVADKAPEPPAAVVEQKSDRQDKTDTKPSPPPPPPPRMMDWIKQGIGKVVPQPELPVHSKTEVSEKTEAPAAPKVEAPAPKPAPAPEPPPAPKPAPAPSPAPKPAAATEKSPKEAEPQPNMMGWIVSELGRMLPQPVQKQDSSSDEVQNRGKGGKSPLK